VASAREALLRSRLKVADPPKSSGPKSLRDGARPGKATTALQAEAKNAHSTSLRGPAAIRL